MLKQLTVTAANLVQHPWASEDGIRQITHVLSYDECTERVNNAQQYRNAELASLQTSNEHTPQAEVARNGIRYAAAERMVRYALELCRLQERMFAQYRNTNFLDAIQMLPEVQPLYANFCNAQAEYYASAEPISASASTEKTDEQALFGCPSCKERIPIRSTICPSCGADVADTAEIFENFGLG